MQHAIGIATGTSTCATQEGPRPEVATRTIGVRLQFTIGLVRTCSVLLGFPSTTVRCRIKRQHDRWCDHIMSHACSMRSCGRTCRPTLTARHMVTCGLGA